MYSFKTVTPQENQGRPEPISLASHFEGLERALSDGVAIPAGRLWGLPDLGDDVWVDIAGAAALAGAKPRTLTGWLARGGPKHNPFPAPVRMLYRLYWRRSAIADWRSRTEAE